MYQIGFSSCFFHPDPNRNIFKNRRLQYFEESMSQYVLSKGCLPVLIPTLPEGSKTSVSDLLNNLDGLLLQGGDDVSSSSYSETPISDKWPGDSFRDSYEIELIKAAKKKGIPILGICRGIQILNVALGGTLYQDIKTQVPKALTHRDPEVYSKLFHEVEIVENSLLSKMYSNATDGVINSVHHQAIKRVASGFKVEAISKPDGIIEAIRWVEDFSEKNLFPYLFAVQWHPEFQVEEEAQLLPSNPILEEFLKAVDFYVKNKKSK